MSDMKGGEVNKFTYQSIGTLEMKGNQRRKEFARMKSITRENNRRVVLREKHVLSTKADEENEMAVEFLLPKLTSTSTKDVFTFKWINRN